MNYSQTHLELDYLILSILYRYRYEYKPLTCTCYFKLSDCIRITDCLPNSVFLNIYKTYPRICFCFSQMLKLIFKPIYIWSNTTIELVLSLDVVFYIYAVVQKFNVLYKKYIYLSNSYTYLKYFLKHFKQCFEKWMNVNT